jgi:Spy/CpxP family protein refolding chaperone
MNKKLLSTALVATLLAITSNMAFADMPKDFDHGKGMPKHQKMSPEERQQKIAEFEKRLNLTDEQKAQIEKNRKNSKKKLDAIRKKEQKLREEAKEILEQNKKDFESLLTPEQKEELKKIEKEREERYKEFKKKHEKKQEKKD